MASVKWQRTALTSFLRPLTGRTDLERVIRIDERAHLSIASATTWPDQSKMEYLITGRPPALTAGPGHGRPVCRSFALHKGSLISALKSKSVGYSRSYGIVGLLAPGRWGILADIPADVPLEYEVVRLSAKGHDRSTEPIQSNDRSQRLGHGHPTRN